MNELLTFGTYIAIHIALEALYIGTYGSGYKLMVERLLKNPGAPENRMWFAIAAYVPFFIATYIFVFRDVVVRKEITLITALLRGIFFGLAVYGVYNFTNMFLIKGYDTLIALRDVLYGVVSMMLLAAAAFYYNSFFATLRNRSPS